MESRKLSIGLAAAAVVVAVVLFVVLRDSNSDSDEPTTTNPAAQAQHEGVGGQHNGGKREGSGGSSVPTIVVRDGKPVGGVQDLSFQRGDDIRFRVKSDVTDEVHMHGYDVLEPIKAGGTTEFDVPATLEGVFEVELEERVEQLAEVTVNP
jgi:hypothetical protein